MNRHWKMIFILSYLVLMLSLLSIHKLLLQSIQIMKVLNVVFNYLLNYFYILSMFNIFLL